MKSAVLILKDGTEFHGVSVGHSGFTVGELVFNTAMSGYEEVITDPSYGKQIVMFTSPHIGNTGINFEDAESSQPWAAGVVLREVPHSTFHWRSKLSLTEYFLQQKVVAIAQIDTRKLTHHLRVHGAMPACIVTEDASKEEAIKAMQTFNIEEIDIVSLVSTKNPYTWHEGLWKQGSGYRAASLNTPLNVVVVDYGVKRNILRHLTEVGFKVTVVPSHSTAEDILKFSPDAVVLSNGPGDPQRCETAVETAKQLQKIKMPILGICLGHQILGLALGGRTIKMKFGQHGINQPVQDKINGHVFITSQNHNYAVDVNSLPSDVQVTHLSLFDDSLQGMCLPNANIMGFQGHPEASPGPSEMRVLFEQFAEMVRKRKDEVLNA